MQISQFQHTKSRPQCACFQARKLSLCWRPSKWPPPQASHSSIYAVIKGARLCACVCVRVLPCVAQSGLSKAHRRAITQAPPPHHRHSYHPSHAHLAPHTMVAKVHEGMNVPPRPRSHTHSKWHSSRAHTDVSHALWLVISSGHRSIANWLSRV